MHRTCGETGLGDGTWLRALVQTGGPARRNILWYHLSVHRPQAAESLFLPGTHVVLPLPSKPHREPRPALTGGMLLRRVSAQTHRSLAASLVRGF